MNIDNFLKCLSSEFSLLSYLETNNEFGYMENKYFLTSKIEAKYNMLDEHSSDTQSYVNGIQNYKEGLVSAILDNADYIKNWLSSSNKTLILNPPDKDFDSLILNSFPKIGYNFQRKSLGSGAKTIETRYLRGLEIKLEKDENNIYIKDVKPNDNMIDLCPFADDSEKDIREDYEKKQRVDSAKRQIENALIAIDNQSEVSDEDIKIDNEKEL